MRRSWSRSGTALEVLSVDALVEGVHFDRAFTPPARHRPPRARRQPERSGGHGRCAAPRLLSLALPPALPIDDFDAMIDGLAALAARHRCMSPAAT